MIALTQKSEIKINFPYLSGNLERYPSGIVREVRDKTVILFSIQGGYIFEVPISDFFDGFSEMVD